VKVLHVIPSVSLTQGGPSKAVRLFAEAAMREGISASIATTDDNGDGSRLEIETGVPLLERGVKVFYFRRTTLAYKVSIDLARWLVRTARDFDLLHIHALFSFSSTATAWAARRCKVPYVVRPLGVLNRWGIENRRALAKRASLPLIELGIIRGAAAMHYTAERERSEAIETLPELARVKSAVIPVPLPESSKEEASANKFLELYPELQGTQIVLFLSRIDAKKGLDLLLDAFSSVVRSCPNTRLVVAGDGDSGFVASQKSRCVSLGIEQAVIWTGWLDGTTKSSALKAATLFVLPSYSENFGIVVAEAMAAGTAVIVTEGVALADEIIKAEAGVVTEPNAQPHADSILS
jgi:glycosyltransferase involved in cell wall biosynthesis